jgi:hypothetical protein
MNLLSILFPPMGPTNSQDLEITCLPLWRKGDKYAAEKVLANPSVTLLLFRCAFLKGDGDSRQSRAAKSASREGFLIIDRKKESQTVLGGPFTKFYLFLRRKPTESA